MDVIQQFTLKTSKGSGQASDSVGELSSMVGAMRKSVAGFKLPGMENSQDIPDSRDTPENTGNPLLNQKDTAA